MSCKVCLVNTRDVLELNGMVLLIIQTSHELRDRLILFRIINDHSESVNRTDNTMAKSKKDKQRSKKHYTEND
jgi:hypothetical protein